MGHNYICAINFHCTVQTFIALYTQCFHIRLLNIALHLFHYINFFSLCLFLHLRALSACYQYIHPNVWSTFYYVLKVTNTYNHPCRWAGALNCKCECSRQFHIPSCNWIHLTMIQASGFQCLNAAMAIHSEALCDAGARWRTGTSKLLRFDYLMVL